VTNAVLDQKLQTLADNLGSLATSVKEGFEGVHARQDKTNGKVITANEDINSLTAKFEYNRIIWYLLTVSISVIIALGSYILFNRPH
jgi:hypothetical protein